MEINPAPAERATVSSSIFLRSEVAIFGGSSPETRHPARASGNAPLAYIPGTWDKGEHTGWQRQVKARSGGQNEDRRIGHWRGMKCP